MSWRACTVGNLVDEGIASIQTGPFGTQLKASHYIDGDGIPVINVRNIGLGTVKPEKLEFVAEQTAERLAVHTLQRGDIVFGRKGAVDRHLFVKADQEGWLQGSDCIRLRFTGQRVIPQFISYAFLSTPHKKWMLTQSGNKATMASLNHDIIKRIPVYLPSMLVQEDIASTLSDYDDLIENNHRRIQLLEQASRLLYKEWFVYLRFPGHEHVKIVDGVPDEWERKTVFDVMDVLSGGTPKTHVPDFWDGTIPFFTPKDSVESPYVSVTEKTLSESGLKNCSSMLYPKDTVFITARGTVGKVNLAATPMAMNQSCYALASKPPLNQVFLFFALKENVEQFRSRAVGSVFDAIIRDTFKLIPFTVPHERLIHLFADRVSPILAQIHVLMNQTQALAQARDLVLPRLMNGEITV